jgi:hypothetical protein
MVGMKLVPQRSLPFLRFPERKLRYLMALPDPVIQEEGGRDQYSYLYRGRECVSVLRGNCGGAGFGVMRGFSLVFSRALRRPFSPAFSLARSLFRSESTNGACTLVRKTAPIEQQFELTISVTEDTIALLTSFLR